MTDTTESKIPSPPSHAATVRTIDELLADIREIDPPLASRSAVVTITLYVDDVDTPLEARDKFLLALMQRGADDVPILVSDSENEDDEFLVKNGRTFHSDEVDQAFATWVPTDGDEDDDERE